MYVNHNAVLNPHWVAKGLVLAVIGDRWITPTGNLPLVPVNAPRLTSHPRGMVSNWGSANGSNTTARYNAYRLYSSPTGQRSYLGFCRAQGLGGGGFGRIFQDVAGTGASNRPGEEGMWLAAGAGSWNTPHVSFATTDLSLMQVGAYGDTIFTTLGWASYGFSCKAVPGAFPAEADFRVYINGRASQVAVNSNPTSNYAAGGYTDMTFGNRASDSLRNFDGQLGPLFVFNSLLTAGEHSDGHANPAQFLATRRVGRYFTSPVAVNVYRPGGDVIVNGWTATPAGSLYQRIDDVSIDLADYISSPNMASPATLSWDYPLAAGTHDLEVVFKSTPGTGSLRLVLLDSGGGVVGTSDWQAATSVATTYTFIGVNVSATAPNFRIEIQP